MKIVAVGYVYIRDKKLLLVRSHNKHAFYLPGGKPVSGETDNETLARELREELSVDLTPLSVQPFQVFEAPAYGEPAGINVILRCYMGFHAGSMKPSSEIEEIGFFSSGEYNRMSETAPAVILLFRELKKRGLTG